MASTDSKTAAAPIVAADETTPPKAPKPPTAAQRKRAEKAASQAKATAPAAPVEAATPSIPDLFRKGRTIAQIARTIQKGQDVVRAALDEAGVDYTADKNAKAVGSTPAPATPAAPKEWTLLSSYKAILAKKVDPKSKRGRIVADLATGANTGDLVEIIASLASLSEGDAAKLAAGANALNAALSAHYARVS